VADALPVNAGKPGLWRFIIHEGTQYASVGINTDGTLHNPNGYPEDKVRAAISFARERQHQRRSDGARKAAATRARRREQKVAALVALLRSGGRLTPGKTCQICRKFLDDPESIARSVGSDCWQDVLTAMEGDGE
jgi:hypothetical protein